MRHCAVEPNHSPPPPLATRFTQSSDRVTVAVLNVAWAVCLDPIDAPGVGELATPCPWVNDG